MTASASEIGVLHARLEVLEAEAEIRRLMSAHQWWSDAGTDTSDIPDWAAPATEPDPTGRQSRWSSDSQWRGSGLSDMFGEAPRNDYSHSPRNGGADGTPFSAPRPMWMPHMMHFLTNEWIKVEDPENAIARWYSWEAATVIVDGEEMAVWIAGRYDGAFCKERGAWRIRELHFQEIFSTPFDSAGWTKQAHVRYGPGQVTPR